MSLQIIALECKGGCKGILDFEQRIRASMRTAVRIGGADSDLLFRGALGGVLLCPETTQEQKDQINSTVHQMRALEAIMKGVPVDADAFAADIELHPPLPLMLWWREERVRASVKNSRARN